MGSLDTIRHAHPAPTQPRIDSMPRLDSISETCAAASKRLREHSPGDTNARDHVSAAETRLEEVRKHLEGSDTLRASCYAQNPLPAGFSATNEREARQALLELLGTAYTDSNAPVRAQTEELRVALYRHQQALKFMSVDPHVLRQIDEVYADRIGSTSNPGNLRESIQHVLLFHCEKNGLAGYPRDGEGNLQAPPHLAELVAKRPELLESVRDQERELLRALKQGTDPRVVSELIDTAKQLLGKLEYEARSFST